MLQTSVFRSLAICTTALMLSGMPTAGTQAAQVLLYDDDRVTSDRWATALAGLGHTVTFVSDDTDFSNQITAGGWALVVAQFDQDAHAGGSTPGVATLAGYVTSGGRAVYSHFFNSTATDAAFGVTPPAGPQFTLTPYTLSLTRFTDGLSGTLFNIVNPYSVPPDFLTRSFTAAPGSEVAATFTQNGRAGIVIGNGNRTIINGFLGGTLPAADEVRLYQNQVNFLLSPQGIPTPGSLLLLGIGLAGLIGTRQAMARRRPVDPGH